MAASRDRNPAWSRDETILLLDLYLRHPSAEARHPEVAALSATLRDLASETGTPRPETFRNPVGIAMKLRNLAQQDPAFQQSGRAGLGHGNRLNAEIWRLLANDPVALAAEVKRVRHDIATQIEGPGGRTPSRGPVPTFGSFGVARSDGETQVYVLTLNGFRSWLASRHDVPHGFDILKVGISNDVERRLGELNAGLPAVLDLRWRKYWSIVLPVASDAYMIEQAVLSSVEERGWSGGGEFVIAPAEQLVAQILATLHELAPEGPTART
ncbi:GIY-YIG nuclease family protein [Sphingomonas carotinifaciens]|uniref:Uncharacterized protein n=1 Tax=Sphingomonas carotinifaciens TaxID=1166323 RepID=A0A1G7PP55_9SPHN|nr:GIY-YIG nuclease family protein [Sphingomonas carotinifaciens]MBB4087450.1 hypothetical protein [Sphingomonas carotinifaciens]MWC45721.1 hypothetical protein [Sphingomonas carotinifaciens]SDF88182.1 hypothetical protein SAMN05216557_10725 [Sphingomonas carotinifaciens]